VEIGGSGCLKGNVRIAIPAKYSSTKGMANVLSATEQEKVVSSTNSLMPLIPSEGKEQSVGSVTVRANAKPVEEVE
jgi:hypothetical protein